MWRLQSLAPWSGLSVLSPTSWLFKRAKEQERSFLNTQIHVCRRRDRCLAKEPPHCPPPSPHLVPTLPPHLGLGLSTPHYPPSSIGLITPRFLLLLPSTALSLSSNLSFIETLTLLFIPVPLFTFLLTPPHDFRHPLASPSPPSQYSPHPFVLRRGFNPTALTYID